MLKIPLFARRKNLKVRTMIHGADTNWMKMLLIIYFSTIENTIYHFATKWRWYLLMMSANQQKVELSLPTQMEKLPRFLNGIVCTMHFTMVWLEMFDLVSHVFCSCDVLYCTLHPKCLYNSQKFTKKILVSSLCIVASGDNCKLKTQQRPSASAWHKKLKYSNLDCH